MPASTEAAIVLIRYMMFNAYGAGGTARTVIHQANAMSARHDVEIVSLYRHRETPRFEVNPRVVMRPLTDLGSSGLPRNAPAGPGVRCCPTRGGCPRRDHTATTSASADGTPGSISCCTGTCVRCGPACWSPPVRA